MILVQRLSDQAVVPTKVHIDDGGWDLYTPTDIEVAPGRCVKVDIQIAMAIPLGWTGIIQPRSSWFSQKIDSNGTIDAGYRGPIQVMLYNHSTHIKTAKGPTVDDQGNLIPGDRIAQLVPVFTGAGLDQNYSGALADVLTACNKISEAAELPPSIRGSGGFGSSGA